MSSLDDSLQARLAAVRARIGAAAHACGRDPARIRLVAVSKSASAQAVLEALRAGQDTFGESYLQEATAKMGAIAGATDGGRVPPEWHFVGPIQSNKTRAIAESFAWVQSVDRQSIAERLAAQRPGAAGPLNVLLQVNISGESSKQGVAPDRVAQLAATVAALPRLRLRGLMAIPAPGAPEQHAAMRRVFDDLVGLGFAVDTLSIGMSDDFEAAITAGSTMVRVGTAIFGPRSGKR